MDTAKWALQWRDKVVEAVAWQQHGQLHQLVLQAMKQLPSKEVVLASGCGVLLNDQTIWSRSPRPETASLAQETCSKWKLHCRKFDTPASESKPKHPLAGLKARDFSGAVQELHRWLVEIGEMPRPDQVVRRAAVAIALHGIHSWQHLEGLFPCDVERWTTVDAVRGLLIAAVKVANQLAERDRQRQEMLAIASAEPVLLMKPVAATFAQPKLCDVNCSALVLSDSLQPEVRESRARKLEADLVQNSLEGLRKTSGPMKAVKQLTSAKESGVDVNGVLDNLAVEALEETNFKSFKSLASGIKCWHFFALLLGYMEACTLPPLHDGDVIRYISIFRCGGTAANYIGYLSWACRRMRLSMDWKTEAVSHALAGVKKRTARLSAGTLYRKFVMTEALLIQLVSLARGLGESSWANRFVIAFDFLLRVQSELCHMYAGCDKDASTLAEGVCAALWICKRRRVAYLRLRRRKNRPNGSLLSRSCTCAACPALCSFCAVAEETARVNPGDELWHVSAHEFLKMLRRYLVLLLCKEAERATLKCFRAGKACCLAAAGTDIKIILELGEWRSKAVMSYLSSEAIDEMQVLRCSLEESDSENESLVKARRL